MYTVQYISDRLLSNGIDVQQSLHIQEDQVCSSITQNLMLGGGWDVSYIMSRGIEYYMTYDFDQWLWKHDLHAEDTTLNRRHLSRYAR